MNKKEIKNKLQKALTIEYIRDYCKENKISIKKLEKEIFWLSYNCCGFFHPSDIKPNGLLNDMETLPKTTLIIKHENERLFIEQTEYTKEYLVEDVFC